jgi:hypothetical protein
VSILFTSGGEYLKRLKVYLDTSVLSHLDAPDALKEQECTRKLWGEFQENGKYNVCISPITILEVLNCPEPKQSFVLKQLQAVPHTVLEEAEEVFALANQYLKAGILPKKSLRDRQHIAYACVYNCDMVVSWNFRHMVNYKTISGVKSVNALAGYKEMPIYTPTMLIKGGSENDT